MELIILPFKTEQLWDILQSDDGLDKVYDIDVKSSIDRQLKDSFVYYISNVGLKCNLHTEDLSYEQKEKLILQYLDINKVYNDPVLALTLMSILLRVKGIDILEKSMFNEEECDQFINKYLDKVATWVTFLDSTLLYYEYQIKGLAEHFDKSKYREFITRDIPISLMVVFEYQEFLSFWSIVKPENLFWFKRQFESNFFCNQSIADFIFSKNNLLAAFAYWLSQHPEAQ